METGSTEKSPLMAWLASADNRKAYAAWLADPVTKRILEIVEGSIRPMEKPSGVTANYYAGRLDGRFETLRLIRNLDEMFVAVKSARETGNMTETFAMPEENLATWGLTLKKYQEMAARAQRQE